MGHINNLLVRMVEGHHGEEGVQKLFELAKIEPTRYKTEVVYPEEEFQALYRAAKKVYGVDDDAAQKSFADFYINILPEMFPSFFEEAKNARGLLKMVPTIHLQWPSAASAKDFKEKLWLIHDDEERLVYKYDSPNRLCGVLKHVAQGVLGYYKEQGSVVENQCALKGSPWCEVEIRFHNSQ